MIKRILLTIKMAYFCYKNNNLFTEQIFVTMAKILDNAIKTATDDKPYTIHLYLDNKRIVSFWMYPGLNKNPVDRISELIEEIDALKERLYDLEK